MPINEPVASAIPLTYLSSTTYFSGKPPDTLHHRVRFPMLLGTERNEVFHQGLHVWRDENTRENPSSRQARAVGTKKAMAPTASDCDLTS